VLRLRFVKGGRQFKPFMGVRFTKGWLSTNCIEFHWWDRLGYRRSYGLQSGSGLLMSDKKTIVILTIGSNFSS